MSVGSKRSLLFLATVLILAPPVALPANAQQSRDPDQQPSPDLSFPESGEVLMQADELSYDKETRIVTASGNVELAYGERVLVADRVTYSETSGVVTADGNVALLDPQGDVAFADHLVLRNEMRDGVIDTLKVLLSDNSRLAGHSVVRSGGNITTLHRGVYSPCDICEEKVRRHHSGKSRPSASSTTSRKNASYMKMRSWNSSVSLYFMCPIFRILTRP